MIRINLANKKQASYVAGASASSPSPLKSFSSSGSASAMKEVLGRVVFPLLFCVGAYFGYDYYIQTQEDQMKNEVAVINKEKTRIETELARIKGFEVVKTELEQNQEILRNKIDTIEKLIKGRDYAIKSLVAISLSLPKDVWLTELNETDTNFDFKGSTFDLGLISDVMTKLGQTVYFKEVSLNNSATEPDGRQINFELSARRE